MEKFLCKRKDPTFYIVLASHKRLKKADIECIKSSQKYLKKINSVEVQGEFQACI